MQTKNFKYWVSFLAANQEKINKKYACVVFIKIATPFKNISKENTNLRKVMVVWNFI